MLECTYIREPKPFPGPRFGRNPAFAIYVYPGNPNQNREIIMDLSEGIDRGRERLARAIEKHKPEKIFAGFSGGGDSLVATHLLNDLRGDVGTLHINTGIGFKKTREYVRETCRRNGWDLIEYRAKENGHDYDEMVRGNVKGVPGGFPGPPMHTFYYRRLKERQLEQAHRDFKGQRGNKIMMVTGIRKDESVIRAGYDNQVKFHNGVVWVSLIYDISAHQKQKYIDVHGLKTNPVSDVYGMSGECLCGAFDENGGRLTELKHAAHKFGEPETYERIVNLQNDVWERYPWRWDQRRPEWFERAQQGQLALDVPGSEDNNRIARMCVGCGKGPNGTVGREREPESEYTGMFSE